MHTTCVRFATARTARDPSHRRCRIGTSSAETPRASRSLRPAIAQRIDGSRARRDVLGDEPAGEAGRTEQHEIEFRSCAPSGRHPDAITLSCCVSPLLEPSDRTRSLGSSRRARRMTAAGVPRSPPCSTTSPMPRVLLMKRTERAGDPWSGHISLPGGRHDRTDADLLATAIRETARGARHRPRRRAPARQPARAVAVSAGPNGIEVTPFVFVTHEPSSRSSRPPRPRPRSGYRSRPRCRARSTTSTSTRVPTVSSRAGASRAT